MPRASGQSPAQRMRRTADRDKRKFFFSGERTMGKEGKTLLWTSITQQWAQPEKSDKRVGRNSGSSYAFLSIVITWTTGAYSLGLNLTLAIFSAPFQHPFQATCHFVGL